MKPTKIPMEELVVLVCQELELLEKWFQGDEKLVPITPQNVALMTHVVTTRVFLQSWLDTKK